MTCSIFHSQDTDSDQQSCLRNSVVDQVEILVYHIWVVDLA